MNDTALLTYGELQIALDNAECLITAAELQGLLVGFYAGGLSVDAESWQKQLIPLLVLSDDKVANIDAELKRLNRDLVSMLTAQIFGLEMMLPEEDASLMAQAEALGLWCQGFTQGFLTQRPKPEIKDEDALDALGDVEAVAQIDLDSIEDTPEDEKALFEIIEHIKVATQMLHSIFGQPAVDPKQSLH